MRPIPMLRLVHAALLALLTLAAPSARAAAGAGPSPTEVDQLVARAMREFQVPGMAVGIVKDGKLVFAKGYGVRELGKPGAVDADTVFAIGSISKSFTSAALAILVDEGKLRWDDRVIDHLPEFRLWDPYVTREFTIRDLLTHRSGLGLGAGDLMFVPASDFTRADLMHALRYFKPVSSFRSQFAYDNSMYVIAGEVVAAASGRSWEQFVDERLLAPLGMAGCASASVGLADKRDVAEPHVVVDGTLRHIQRLEIPMVGAAGGVQCNLNGMAKWVAVQLAHGRKPDGSALFSAAQAAEMWTPQTLLRSGSHLDELTHTHLQAYGLAWNLQDFNGYERISHNGGLPGMVTHVGMLPELGVGVIVLTNQQEGFALTAVALPILESFAGAPRHDWVAEAKAIKAKRLAMIADADAAAHAAATPLAPLAPGELAAYVATYADPWRGNATIAREGAGLRLTFSHTSGMTGPLEPQSPDLFIARWDDRSMNADAYVLFKRDYGGRITGFTMRAVSAATDFSYDFQDLDFSRIADGPPAARH